MPSTSHPLRQEDQFRKVGNQTNNFKGQPQGSVSNPLQASFSQTYGNFDHGVIKVELTIPVKIEHHPSVNQCSSTPPAHSGYSASKLCRLKLSIK